MNFQNILNCSLNHDNHSRHKSLLYQLPTKTSTGRLCIIIIIIIIIIIAYLYSANFICVSRHNATAYCHGVLNQTEYSNYKKELFELLHAVSIMPIRNFVTILCSTGSQCNSLNTGLIWSNLRLLDIILAALFWQHCSRSMWDCFAPYNRLLQ